jgi:hypothetical protein
MGWIGRNGLAVESTAALCNSTTVLHDEARDVGNNFPRHAEDRA